MIYNGWLKRATNAGHSPKQATTPEHNMPIQTAMIPDFVIQKLERFPSLYIVIKRKKLALWTSRPRRMLSRSEATVRTI